MRMHVIKTFLFLVILLLRHEAFALRCYQCMGTQPGCSEEMLDWRLVKNLECPDPYDICVKITDTVLGSNLTTRGCLSTFVSARRDIPADKYEGCRSGAQDVRFNKDVKVAEPHQMIVERSHSVFCFCSWDNYCNVSAALDYNVGVIWLMLISTAIHIYPACALTVII